MISDSGSIWSSDGTSAGTVVTLDNYWGIAPINTGYLYCDNSDGSLLVLHALGSTSSLIYENFQLSCLVYFRGNIGNSVLLEVDNSIWITGGTADSTNMLTGDVGFGNLGRSNVFKLSNGYLFSGDSVSTSGSELWRTNGTSSGTQKLRNFPTALISKFTVASSGVFFIAESATDYQLWHSNGTSSGTILVKNLPRYISDLRWTEGQRLYFTIDNRLWHSDGTSNGTYKLQYFTPDVSIDNGNVKWISPILLILMDDELSIP